MSDYDYEMPDYDQRRQSGLKTGGSRVLKVQQEEVRSTGFSVSSSEIFIQYSQICLFQ